jgi:signal transduction histidine kinase
MNGVIGMTDLALDMATDDGQRRFLAIAKNSAEALMVVLNEILDFSRIEAGQLVLEHTGFEVRQLVQDTLAAVEARTMKKGLSLEHVLPDDLPQRLVGDPGRIRQVLTNLCDNAIKFTHKGGLSVHLRWLPDHIGDGELQFSVSDTGIGIAPDKQQLIFEAFSQAETSNAREFGGTGLGLTICMRLVSLMGGRIWVDSQPGTGSTFHFTVRLQVARLAPQTVAELQAAG